MQIRLESLPHQDAALKALLEAMPPLAAAQNMAADAYANPLLARAGEEAQFIDIKMETGTGKTYVYTRALYALREKLGLFKFIIIVPSLAIKAGTQNFIDHVARRHFRSLYPEFALNLHILQQGDFAKKKGRKTMPGSLTQFCEAAKAGSRCIECLLISDKGFLDRDSSGLFKADYDQNLFGGYNCPADGLAAARPVVIIDEPHRLKRDGKSYQNLMKHLRPQMILRFGATFPETGGKGAERKIDYYRGRPQYDLTAVDAFNQDLVKGVSVQYPVLGKEAAPRYKVKNLANKLLTLEEASSKRLHSYAAGEVIDVLEGGISYDGNKKLSNELELWQGMELMAGVFSHSYQEAMLRQALDAHFAAERELFLRPERNEGGRVKCCALFFIDSIDAYRDSNGRLKLLFERLLREKLQEQMREFPSGDYHDFLQASLSNISGTHGGYFAKDWGEPDDSAIAEEVQDILHKERVLGFKHKNGGWKLRRFFFSKWTLREGWDNPNVFTICKLRSSGSEISKLQEVGRGLRLPVDEFGARLAESSFRLNFLISADEADFAKKLVAEVNSDAPLKLNSEKLTDAMAEAICRARGAEGEALPQAVKALREQLGAAGIINFSGEFKEGGYDQLLKLYPELLAAKTKEGKILAPGEKPKKIKLRQENWQKIRELWEKLACRHMLQFEPLPEAELTKLFGQALAEEGALHHEQEEVRKQNLAKQEDEETLLILQESREFKRRERACGMGYNLFVKALARQTCLPPQLIHQELWARLSQFSAMGEDKVSINARLNYSSLARIVKAWQEIFARQYATRYQYKKLAFTAETSVLKRGKGGASYFVAEIEPGVLGIRPAEGVGDDKRNLYDLPIMYDSAPELEVERLDMKGRRIAVFGKIPRRAIKVPLYTGGTTTPDFIYSYEQNGEMQLALLVEMKSEDMRGGEKRAVKAQEHYFKQFGEKIHWKVLTKAEDVAAVLGELEAQMAQI